MKISTTLDRKAWKKWLICPTLAVLLAMTVLPVYASESQTEPSEAITDAEEAGSESAQESETLVEQLEIGPEEQSSEQQDIFSEEPSSEQQETVWEEFADDQQGETSEGLMLEQQIDSAEITVAATNTDWKTTKPHEGEVLHSGYVGFKNKASGKYLTIPNGATATGTNICQQSQSTVVNAQEFYLSYTYLPNKSVAYFYIFPVNASGNTASTRVKSAAISSAGVANVSLQIFMPTEMTDRWQIVHAHDNYYYIYLASRPDTTGTKYALTANSGNGTQSGTSTSAAGNVYVSAYTGADNQLWQICADGDPMDIYANDITQSAGEVIVDSVTA